MQLKTSHSTQHPCRSGHPFPLKIMLRRTRQVEGQMSVPNAAPVGRFFVVGRRGMFSNRPLDFALPRWKSLARFRSLILLAVAAIAAGSLCCLYKVGSVRRSLSQPAASLAGHGRPTELKRIGQLARR